MIALSAAGREGCSYQAPAYYQSPEQERTAVYRMAPFAALRVT